ncbi:hypothetical protein [Pseudomonas sp. F3-2]|uniref:hypothetical protein n=1 Tax=Pseudomonas sp. F3-2 TaxID=3141539 RepID=UPI00315D79D7
MFLRILAVLILVVLSGCSNQKFKPEYQSQIHTIKILPVVWSTKDINYMGREQAWGAALGAGAGVAAGAAFKASGVGTAALSGAGFAAGMKAGDLASMSTVEAIVYSMNSANIDLGEIVRKNFADKLATTGRFKIVSEQTAADAELQLTVNNWGFALTQGFSSVVYPTISVRGSLKRGDERVWQKTEYITPFNSGNTYGYTPLRYRTEPELLRTALDGVSQIVDEQLVKDLVQ